MPPRIRASELWRVPETWLEQAQDDATLLAIRDQERAGLDILTDGEMRRESYSNRFATALDGLDLDHPGEIIRVTLKYTDDRRSAITGLRRVSRPGQRHYVDHSHIPKVQGGMGTAIVSTSRGVMTGHEARDAGVGGEVVAHVW